MGAQSWSVGSAPIWPWTELALEVFVHDYSEIFSARARQYHYAMQQYPLARNAEFRAILQDLPADATEVLDVPSGGGYLHSHLAPTVNLLSCDFSEGFAETGVPLASPEHLPFTDASLDAVLSLTGLHHVPRLQQQAFLRECWRVLRPGGRICVGEVWRGSPVDTFLNDFVHRHNSQGHVGEFLDAGFMGLLEQAGFADADHVLRHYEWTFNGIPAMVDYCRNLFGIDRADDAQLEAGLREYLGFRAQPEGGFALPWQLVFYRAQKP